MEIKSAKFVMSNSEYQKCPPPHRAEFAFIGRSNVGKSSLINSLTFTKGLAKTSQTPGKTQLINHFLINDRWFLVDLPGYGYAKVSKEIRQKFEKMIFDYLLKRENLVCLYILVDIRHKPQPIDVEFMNRMGEAQIPFYVVFTKADKLSNKQIQESVETYQQILGETWEELPEMFITSAEKHLGREEILQSIEDLIKSSPYK
ncbi:YihA family ribosome biogenesis GTP-binding protein [Sandaracinomonas limnophila]|uniref:Probable GTP-binding protein EngB n=1 Tax=Sandaracinomonas limnophila TaxID=1862386 RepID=A0A437PRN0_9BACT|nr:ribosome biogenesis GTP-binding protein YihA/YsxC [Sandaracinomonas limnophila]RVU24899.1 YihA family ribosome biogenesis GTP-binding protein [Sandaracinomonas limnophila]